VVFVKTDDSSARVRNAGQIQAWLRSPLLWIAVVALAVRCAAVVAVVDWQQPPSDKVQRFDAIALSLMEGNGFSRDGSPTASTEPLYPLLLAGVYSVFGYSATAIRLVLALIDTLHCLLWVLIARNCLGARAGWVTGVLIAVCPYFVYLVVTAGSDTPFLFLHAAFLLLLVRSMASARTGGFLAVGFALGLATLCRAGSLMMPVFLVPFVLLRFRDSLKRGAVAVALIAVGFTVTLTPWTVRNFVQFHRLVPVQTLGGYHLLLASGESSEDALRHTKKELGDRGYGDATRDVDYYRSALNRIIREPGGFVRSMGHRLVKMWYVTHSGRGTRVLGVANLLLLLMATVGVVVSRGHWQALLPLYATITYYILLHSVLFAIFRYIMPVIPALIVFASAALLDFAARYRGIERGPV
jgi:4-amino-4-deoxy-L-arabinose transferase-like glycosyltransferase